MRTIIFLLDKEFRQIFRNKTILPIIFAVPILQLIILPLAANYEVRNIKLVIVNRDNTAFTQRLVNTITSSGYFQLTGLGESFDDALRYIESDQADLVLEIPRNFEQDLVRQGNAEVFVAVNAVNGVKAGLASAYLGTIIREYNRGVRIATAPSTNDRAMPEIQVASSNWYNPEMKYQLFMVPGILAVLVTMIGGYLASLNIVREKEVGTIEQINVTPIRKHHFILGKLLPFWLLGLVVFSIGLLVSWLVYGIVPVGNLLVLYAFVALYLIAVLGLGLLISTYTETQQQAMFVAFFFVMIFILMSGLFTPIESMPAWAKVVARMNPVSYFIEVMRMVVLKGSGFGHVLPHFAAAFLFAVFFNGWAIMNYRKTS